MNRAHAARHRFAPDRTDTGKRLTTATWSGQGEVGNPQRLPGKRCSRCTKQPECSSRSPSQSHGRTHRLHSGVHAQENGNVRPHRNSCTSAHSSVVTTPDDRSIPDVHQRTDGELKRSVFVNNKERSVATCHGCELENTELCGRSWSPKPHAAWSRDHVQSKCPERSNP